MVGFAIIVGAALAGNGSLFQMPQGLALGFITGFFLTGATMAANDFFDREIDAINEPERPIPSGLIRPSEALGEALVFTVVALAAAILTNWQSFLLAFLSWIVFVLYTTKGKRTGLLGNLMVSFCIAVPFIYGGFVVGKKLVLTTVIFAVIVALSNTGREVTKGIVDIHGDRESNVKTIAVLYGAQKAGFVSAAFHFSAILLTPLPYVLGLASIWYIPFIAFTVIGLTLTSILLLLDPSRENARKAKTQELLWFFIGLLAFIAGTIH